jgi:hypothetical protein
MLKKIKSFICKIFHIKACQCVEKVNKVVSQDVLELTAPVVGHCGSHTRFKKSCPACVGIA